MGETMTNNPTIDGVSRDTLTIALRLVTRELETLANGSAIQHHKAALTEIRALLDAPAVGRQEPLMVKLTGPKAWLDSLHPSQVPVLRAMAENYRNGHSWDFLDGEAVSKAADEITALQSTIAQLQARVHELESGRVGGIWFPRELGDGLAELIAEKARVCGGGAFDIWEEICERFGNAPPAPVAVLLPERDAFEQFIIKRDGAIWVTVFGKVRSYNEPIERDYGVWQACLDATAALNDKPTNEVTE